MKIRKIFGISISNLFISFLIAVACGVLTPFSLADAKVYEISVIKSRDLELYNSALEGFRAAMTEKGFVEGTDVSYTYYNMGGDPGEGRRIVDEIKAKGADLVLTIGLGASRTAQRNIKDIPIIFTVVLDPVGNGLVRSLESSDNNLTGVSIDVPSELQLRALRDIRAKAQRVGVIYDPSKSQKRIDDAARIAELLGLQLVAEPVKSHKEVPEAVRGLLDRIDALWLIADSTVVTRPSLEYIIVRTRFSRKLVVGFTSYIARAGALFALSCDYDDVGRQSGELAAEVLKGKSPGEVPIAGPRKTHLILNLRVAEKLEIEIPAEILEKAEVIE